MMPKTSRITALNDIQNLHQALKYEIKITSYYSMGYQYNKILYPAFFVQRFQKNRFLQLIIKYVSIKIYK